MSSSLGQLANALGEVCFFVGLGYVCGEFGWITKDVKAVSQIVSQFALPALFFTFAATLDIGNVNWAPVVGMVLVRFLMIILMGFLAFAMRLKPFYAQWGILGIFATQSNDIALGLPVINALWDNDKYEFGNYTVIHSTLALVTSSVCIALILIGEAQRPKKEQIEHRIKMDQNPKLLYKMKLKKRRSQYKRMLRAQGSNQMGAGVGPKQGSDDKKGLVRRGSDRMNKLARLDKMDQNLEDVGTILTSDGTSEGTSSNDTSDFDENVNGPHENGSFRSPQGAVAIAVDDENKTRATAKSNASASASASANAMHGRKHTHERHAHGKGKKGSNIKLKAFWRVLKSLVKNPLMLSVIVGTLFNVTLRLIEHKSSGSVSLPTFVSDVAATMGDSFDFLSLLLMGLGMVGKVNKDTFLGKQAILPICLVIVKMFIMALLARFLVLMLLGFESHSTLVEPAQQAEVSVGQLKSAFENYSFFYGLLPPAVTPVVLAQAFNLMPEVITNATIMSTIFAAPYMFVTALVLNAENQELLKHVIRYTMYICNSFSVVGCALLLIWIVGSKKGRRGRMFPMSLVFWLVLSQGVFAGLKFVCNMQGIFASDVTIWFLHLFFRYACHMLFIMLSIVNLVYVRWPDLIFAHKMKWQYGTVLLSFGSALVTQGLPYWAQTGLESGLWVAEYSTQCWIWYDYQIVENIALMCLGIAALTFTQSMAMYTKWVSTKEVDKLKKSNSKLHSFLRTKSASPLRGKEKRGRKKRSKKSQKKAAPIAKVQPVTRSNLNAMNNSLDTIDSSESIQTGASPTDAIVSGKYVTQNENNSSLPDMKQSLLSAASHSAAENADQTLKTSSAESYQSSGSGGISGDAGFRDGLLSDALTKTPATSRSESKPAIDSYGSTLDQNLLSRQESDGKVWNEKQLRSRHLKNFLESELGFDFSSCVNVVVIIELVRMILELTLLGTIKADVDDMNASYYELSVIGGLIIDWQGFITFLVFGAFNKQWREFVTESLAWMSNMCCLCCGGKANVEQLDELDVMSYASKGRKSQVTIDTVSRMLENEYYLPRKGPETPRSPMGSSLGMFTGESE